MFCDEADRVCITLFHESYPLNCYHYCSFMWLADYIYAFFFRTHRLDVVEFTALPNERGTQVLWRNPENLKIQSGQYVQIRLPWLSEGGEEWHPFSVYQTDATEDGIMLASHELYDVNIDIEGASDLDDPLDLNTFVRTVLMEEYIREDIASTNELARDYAGSSYDTTQIFIAPGGDWSRRVNSDVKEQKHLRSCWVRGPYTSPYHIGNAFSHLILTATGT